VSCFVLVLLLGEFLLCDQTLAR